MKKLAIAGLMTIVSITPALAETVEDHFKTITKRVPYTETVCNIVDVPIYGNTGGGC